MPLEALPPHDVTDLLRAWRGGDEAARDELLERVYKHLKRIAAAQLRSERAGHTLQATALVHESYLRLIDQARVDWRDRAHFFGLVATTMRRVLVDHARRRGRKKRSL
ncbi:MAG: ECF-type sigma factor, partial [Thermoanaerobaculia bacterium]